MCWKCKKNLSVISPVSRTETCPYCHADVRVCKNCVFYSLGSHYDCHETIDEQILDKEKANFCEHFKLSPQKNATEITTSENNAKKNFNSLFGE